ncbi:CPBP family intramembrane glutamic endopeptidase [Chloroflexota bacterium]
MKKITDWIKEHQIYAFFIITFLITWGLGYSYIAVLRQGNFLLISLASIATCGPALAGIIISAVTNTERKLRGTGTLWFVFFAALGVATLVVLANQEYINRSPVSPPFVLAALMIAAPVAYVISMAYSRVPAVRTYLSSLAKPRGAVGWYLFALLFIPALALLSVVVSGWLGRQPAVPTSLPVTGLPLLGLIAIKFLYQMFFFNTTGEEVGWRGFAWPRLQAHLSPLIASLILTFFWAIWHLFLWYAEGQAIFSGQYWLETFINLIPASLLIGWVYNRSKGSILAAGITHAAANTTFAFFINLDWPVYTVMMYIFSLVIVMIDKMWQKLPTDHPAVIAKNETQIAGG